jgi:polyribonucleotide nucleotidyltransferase
MPHGNDLFLQGATAPLGTATYGQQNAAGANEKQPKPANDNNSDDEAGAA